MTHKVEDKVAPGAAPPVAGETRIYTCPMHPEVRQSGPGACPGCGMALEPVAPPAGPMGAELFDEEPGPGAPRAVSSLSSEHPVAVRLQGRKPT